MPWRGPEVPGEVPTLGGLVVEWIEAHCVIPDGIHAGEPFLLTREMADFVAQFYALDAATGRFLHFRGGQLVRPQKWGKGPFSAALAIAEAHHEAPVLFDGWDAQGEPVGRPWPTPWVQITAVSEDQTDNVFRALVPMIELGPLTESVPDTGESRVNLPGGGRIEPVTASARSRLGQRVTFCINDETHSWTAENGGRRLADNQRRNLAGMGGRWLETTNAWDPAEGSVAQQTAESGEPGVYRDRTDPGAGSVFNKRERRQMMRRAYGDSLVRGRRGWVDPDRIDGEIEALLGRDPAQAERFFLNRIRSEADAAFDLDKWRGLAVPTWVPPAGSLITIGVDGARFQDSLAVVACHVDEGFLWPLGIWTRPEHAGDDYEHPLDEVDAVMRDAFEQWHPWRVYIDPQKIGGLVDTWRGRWGERRVHHWTTNRARPMAYAVRAFRDALAGADLCHDGDELLTLHVANARRWRTNVKDEEGRPMMLIGKDRPGSPRKMDGAVACVLAWEARGDAVAADARPRRRGGLVFV
ncbi:MAG: hypothetical protein KDC33_10795 [Thermoleophilia bacterium]|nr:hypothetical protein [Thermoleophilia bacterium]